MERNIFFVFHLRRLEDIYTLKYIYIILYITYISIYLISRIWIELITTLLCPFVAKIGHTQLQAIAATESHRLKSFNRKPEDRSLLLTWRGEHAESASKDVREGVPVRG